METTSLHQTITFSASPRALYELLMDADKHSDLTGSDVVMSRDIGGEFEVFDGYCHGHNIDLAEGRKIIQAWFFDEEGWPEDHYSICKFEFTGNGGETTLTFTQTDIPVHLLDRIAAGWEEFYWAPMQEYLESLKEE